MQDVHTDTKKRHKISFVAAAVVAFLVVGVVVAFIIRANSGKESTEESFALDTAALQVEGANLIDNGDGSYSYDYFDDDVIERNKRLVEIDVVLVDKPGSKAIVEIDGEEVTVYFLEEIEFIAFPDYTLGSYEEIQVGQTIRMLYDPLEKVVARITYAESSQDDAEQLPLPEAEEDDGLDE